MKFLAAFVASASATSYTICEFTRNYYTDADDDCSGSTTGGTTAVLAFVGVCTYDGAQSAWYKIGSCDLAAVTATWHTDGSCSDSAADARTTEYTAIDTCISTDKDGSSAVYSQITALEGNTDAALCKFVAANHSTNACDAAAALSPTLPNRGLPTDGFIGIIDQCYFFAASQYFKITDCTSD